MRYPFLITFWLLSDVLLFITSYVLAYFVRVGWIFSSDFPFTPYLSIVTLVAIPWMIVLLTTRSFSITRPQRSLRNLGYIAYACLVGTAIFALGYYFLFGLFFSRTLLLYALIASTLIISLWHIAFEKVLRHVLRMDPPVFRALIIGVNRESAALIKLMNQKKNPLTPVAILDGTGTKETAIDGVPVLGKLNKLEETLVNEKITHLIQCSDMEQSINLLSACRNRNISYMVLPSVFGIVERDERVESLEGKPVTSVSSRKSALEWFFQ